MRPAQQRLGADPFAVAIDLRLVVQHETPLANGEAQRRLRFGADGERRLHVGVEEAQRVAPAAFASYMAMSACLSSSSQVSPPPLNMATPMLGLEWRTPLGSA